MPYLRDKISAKYLLSKCSSWSLKARTPSAFQQVRRRASHRSIILGRATKGIKVFKKAGGRDARVGREELDVRSRRTCPHTFGWEAIEERWSRVGWWSLGWDHHVSGWWFVGRGFDTLGCFLLRLHSSQLSGCHRFWIALLSPEPDWWRSF